jgi:BirA family biotin operon repressor/biotin-[acetyl-CoA-carboxylase] ligase
MSRTDRLDVDKIEANLKTKRIGQKILVYKSTLSTSNIAAEYAQNKENDGLAIFGEEQTAGRGRAGAKWHSGRADSILCSIVLTDCGCNAELLSLACAVAVAESIGKPASSQAKIKWPNDIILSGKKVAGIILESKPLSGSTAYILGIGINCHQQKESFPAELQQTATSIDIESRSIVDRNSLAKRLLTCLDYWFEVAQKDSNKVTNQWRKLSIQLGHRVSLLFDGRKINGNCVGIDPEKGLILELETGGRKFFDAAHTSIIK